MEKTTIRFRRDTPPPLFKEQNSCGWNTEAGMAIHDVVAGAGLGILSARASLWLLPAEKKLLAKWQRKHRTAVAALPYYDAGQRAAGGVFALAF